MFHWIRKHAWAARPLILFSATYLQKWLGTRVLTAIERLMGMVIVAISVQMLLDGLTPRRQLKGLVERVSAAVHAAVMNPSSTESTVLNFSEPRRPRVGRVPESCRQPSKGGRVG